MVETIRPRNTWSRVSSSTSVKKIDRRKQRQEDKPFQKHLAGKDGSADQEDTGGYDSEAPDEKTVKETESTDSPAAAKTGKRIDIIV